MWPLGLKLAPRSQLFQLGMKVFRSEEHPLYIFPFILLYSRECSLLGVNEGVNIPSRNQSAPLGVKLPPRGKLMMLKTGLKRIRHWRTYIYFDILDLLESAQIIAARWVHARNAKQKVSSQVMPDNCCSINKLKSRLCVRSRLARLFSVKNNKMAGKCTK
jgi:hypothetical protein